MCLTHNPETQSSRSPTKPSLPGMAFFMRAFCSVGFQPARADWKVCTTKLELAGRLLSLFGSEVAEDEAAEVVGDFAEAGGLEVGLGEEAGDVEGGNRFLQGVEGVVGFGEEGELHFTQGARGADGVAFDGAVAAAEDVQGAAGGAELDAAIVVVEVSEVQDALLEAEAGAADAGGFVVADVEAHGVVDAADDAVVGEVG